jgi:hypothetical protein
MHASVGFWGSDHAAQGFPVQTVTMAGQGPLINFVETLKSAMPTFEKCIVQDHAFLSSEGEILMFIIMNGRRKEQDG